MADHNKNSNKANTSPRTSMWLGMLCAFMLGALPAGADGSGDLRERFSFCITTDFVEVDSCYQTLRNTAEEEMVNAYLAAQAAVAEFDRLEGRRGNQSVQLLQDAQVAFEDYRRIHCDWPNNFLNWSQSVPEKWICLTELTLDRADQLRRLSIYDPYDETTPFTEHRIKL